MTAAVPILLLPSFSSLIFAVRRPNFRLEDAVDLRRGEAVATSLPAASVVTLPNVKQCLRLCWYATNCADISYNLQTKSCRLFDVQSHRMALADVVSRQGEMFASMLDARLDQVKCIFLYFILFYQYINNDNYYINGAFISVFSNQFKAWQG